VGKKWKAFVAIALVALIAGIVWTFLPTRVPIYNGKPLSFWLRDDDAWWSTRFTRSWPGRKGPNLDSNAIPYLVKTLKQQDGLAFEIESALYGKMPASIQSKFLYPISSSSLHCRAIDMLGSLGSIARPAVPTLIQTLKYDPDPANRVETAIWLKAIDPRDPKIVQALSEASKDPDSQIRDAAMFNGEPYQSTYFYSNLNWPSSTP